MIAYGVYFIVGVLIVIIASAIYRRFHDRKFIFGQTRIVRKDDGTYRIQIWARPDNFFVTRNCKWMQGKYVCINSIFELEETHVQNCFDTYDEAREVEKKYGSWAREYYDLTSEIKVVE